MKRILVVLIFAIGMTLGTFQANAQNSAYTNFCTMGAKNATTSGLNSSNLLLSSYTYCTVSVYATGTTTLIPLFSNATGTTMNNPFFARADTGQYLFYGATGTVVDVTMSLGYPAPGITTPTTLTGITLGGGGGGMVYPGAGVPVSSGSSWLTSLGIQGTDTNVLTSSTISGTGSALCTDANGGATTVGCLSGTLGGSVSPYFTPYSNAVNQLVNSPDFWDPTGAAQHNFVTTVKEIHQTPETDFIGTGGSAGSIGLKQGTTLAASNNEVQLSAPTSVTAYNFNFPGAQGTGCLNDDGAGNGSWLTGCGVIFIQAIAPPISGSYVILFPNSETPSSAGCTSALSFTDGTSASTAIIGASNCFVGGRSASVTTYGFALPSWLPAGDVSSVYCYSYGNFSQDGGGQVLGDLQQCGPTSPYNTTTFLNSSIPFSIQQSPNTSALSTITGTTISTAGIVISGTGSTCGVPACGAPSIFSNTVTATPFLMVFYSGATAPAANPIVINPPLTYTSAGLGVDLNWPFPAEWINPTTEAIAIASAGTATVGTMFNIIDSTVTSGCITGGGGNQVFGVWNGSCITVFGSGGSTAFQVNGTPLTSAATVNFESSAATDGVTLSFSNPSAGNVQLGYSGILTPAGGGTGVATAPTSGQILIGQGGGVYAPETASGSCTLTSSGAFTCSGGSIPGFGTQTVDVENNYSGANAGAKLIACLADGTLKPGTICDMRGITSEATQPVSLGTAPIEVGRSGPQSVLWPSCIGPTNSFCGAVLNTASTTLATPSAPTMVCSSTGGSFVSAGGTIFGKVNYRTGDAVSASSTEATCTMAATSAGSITVTGPASCPTYTSEYDVTLSTTTGAETWQMNQACGSSVTWTNSQFFPVSKAAPSAATPLPSIIIHNNKSEFYALHTGQAGFPFYTSGSTVATDLLATTDNGYSGIGYIFLYNNGGGTVTNGMSDSGVYIGSIRDHISVSAGTSYGLHIYGQYNDVTWNQPSLGCTGNACVPLQIEWAPQTVADSESLHNLNFNQGLISTKANSSNTGNGVTIAGRSGAGSTFWTSVGSGVGNINFAGTSFEMGAAATNGILATDVTNVNLGNILGTRASFGGTGFLNIAQTYHQSGQTYQAGPFSIHDSSHISGFTDVVDNTVSTDPAATIAGVSGVSFDGDYDWGGGTNSVSSPLPGKNVIDQSTVYGSASNVFLKQLPSAPCLGTASSGLIEDGTGCGSSFLPQVATTGQQYVIFATTATPTSTGSCVSAAGSGASGTTTSVNCPTGARSAQVIWSGFPFPAGITAGQVTAVSCGTISSLTVSGVNVASDIQTCGPSGSITATTILSNAGSTGFATTQTNAVAGITGSQVTAAGIELLSTGSACGNISCGTATATSTTATVNAAYLIVTYTGSPVTAPNAVFVAPPITVTQVAGASVLGIDPQALFPSQYEEGMTWAQATAFALGSPYASPEFWVTDCASTASCTTGGGSTKALVYWNGTNFTIILATGGGGGGCTTNCVIENPTATQIITPTTSGFIPLRISDTNLQTDFQIDDGAGNVTFAVHPTAGGGGILTFTSGVTFTNNGSSLLTLATGGDAFTTNTQTYTLIANQNANLYSEGGSSNNGISVISGHTAANDFLKIGSAFQEGTISASGDVLCLDSTADKQLTDCPAASIEVLGVANNVNANQEVILLGSYVPVSLDGAQNTVHNDFICMSLTTAGKAHDNGTVQCTRGSGVGKAIFSQTSVTSTLIVVQPN